MSPSINDPRINGLKVDRALRARCYLEAEPHLVLASPVERPIQLAYLRLLPNEYPRCVRPPPIPRLPPVMTSGSNSTV